ncbi:hypothetical protein [Geosporobacter ferrireducens]|uniref:DUF5673 domain-containing protein n=1 Tax=Geosporobacter ferrireducens TaxID=1424294 RepID=A0A1D8GJC8_9FIRM|nr:hypothetical protein [Geosporobacter ferrireducens]AOT71013.1 hypothetical protein Gferi_16440 [Geosporobacter ferrireducens]MTI53732.1 hypothetical protein [Geosporobacter ferrireducens]
MTNHTFIIGIVVVILVNAGIMLVTEFRRLQRADQVIMETIRIFNSQLALSCINIVFSLIFAYFWYHVFRDIYKLLKPEDLKGFFQLFNDQYLDSMRQYYYEREMLMELFTVQRYRNSGMVNLFSMIITMISGINGVYTALKRDQICKTAIYVQRAVIPWESVCGFQWGHFWDRREFRRLQPYYELKIYYYNRKTLLGKGKKCEADLCIQPSDKENLDILLNKVISFREKEDVKAENNFVKKV